MASADGDGDTGEVRHVAHQLRTVLTPDPAGAAGAVDLRPDARQRLDDLLAAGRRRAEAEGRLDDLDGATSTLLMAVARRTVQDAGAEAGSDGADIADSDAGGRRSLLPVVEMSAVEAALHALCPIWPFC